MQQQKSSLLTKAHFAFLLDSHSTASFCSVSVIFLISGEVHGQIEKKVVFSLSNTHVLIWIFFFKLSFRSVRGPHVIYFQPYAFILVTMKYTHTHTHLYTHRIVFVLSIND